MTSYRDYIKMTAVSMILILGFASLIPASTFLALSFGVAYTISSLEG